MRFMLQVEITDVSAQYTPLPSGEVSVLNSCRTADGSISQAQGLARRVPPEKGQAPDVGHLQVRFAPAWLSLLPFVWGDYWVIDLDADYQLVAVSEPQREYLWILSRTPQMPAATYQALLSKLDKLGFDLKRIEPSKP